MFIYRELSGDEQKALAKVRAEAVDMATKSGCAIAAISVGVFHRMEPAAGSWVWAEFDETGGLADVEGSQDDSRRAA